MSNGEKGVRRHSICCCCWKYWSFTNCNVYLSGCTGTDWCVSLCAYVCLCVCVYACASVYVCVYEQTCTLCIYAVIVTAQHPSEQTEISTDINGQYRTTYSTISAITKELHRQNFQQNKKKNVGGFSYTIFFMWDFSYTLVSLVYMISFCYIPLAGFFSVESFSYMLGLWKIRSKQ